MRLPTTYRNKPVLVAIKSIDPDGDRMKLVILNNVMNGKLTAKTAASTNASNSNMLMMLYTPDKNFVGNDRFTFKVIDTHSAKSNISTASIVVNRSPNHAPVAVGQSISLEQDVPMHIVLRAIDLDEDDSKKLIFHVVENPLNGKLSRVDTSHGSLIYTPNRGFIGNDVFSFKANDGKQDSIPAAIYLKVKKQLESPQIFIPSSIQKNGTKANGTPNNNITPLNETKAIGKQKSSNSITTLLPSPTQQITNATTLLFLSVYVCLQIDDITSILGQH